MYIFRQALTMVRERNGNRNGAAGEKSVDFWKATHTQVVRDELGPYLKSNQESLQVIRDNTTKLAYIAERFWK